MASYHAFQLVKQALFDNGHEPVSTRAKNCTFMEGEPLPGNVGCRMVISSASFNEQGLTSSPQPGGILPACQKPMH